MSASRRGFTLVEMLVVIGIIGVLAALLLPAVMMAVNRARVAAIGLDITELDKAINSYQEKRSDFPPNFRDYSAFIRHVNKCYPQAAKDTLMMNNLVGLIWPGRNMSNNLPQATDIPTIDEGESLVFWLYLVDNDSRKPFNAAFVAFRINPTDYSAPGAPATPELGVADVLNAPKSPEKLYPFKEQRLIDGGDADYIPSYKASYSGDTAYIYIDSRSYDELVTDFANPARAAYAEDPSAGFTRPYWSMDVLSSTPPVTYKPKNPTAFQIICAGQDGDFGGEPALAGAKVFPTGANAVNLAQPGYQLGDNDNLTNFSEGRRLDDHLPQ